MDRTRRRERRGTETPKAQGNSELLGTRRSSTQLCGGGDNACSGGGSSGMREGRDACREGRNVKGVQLRNSLHR